MDNYIVYVKIDENNNIIILINSSAFLSDVTGWIEIDTGIGDKFHHAQGNYLEKGLIDDDACYNYKLVDGVVIERSADEKQAEIAARPPMPPSPEERFEALEMAMLAMLDL